MFDKTHGAWAALSWRYDSGLVAGSVGSIDDALALTRRSAGGDRLLLRQHGRHSRQPDHQLRLRRRRNAALSFRPTGTEDDVNNPPRIAPRHLFDLGLGVDNLFHSDNAKVRVRFSVINLTNKEALYNFLSTFSGTHFVTPRAYQVHLGVTF